MKYLAVLGSVCVVLAVVFGLSATGWCQDAATADEVVKKVKEASAFLAEKKDAGLAEFAE